MTHPPLLLILLSRPLSSALEPGHVNSKDSHTLLTHTLTWVPGPGGAPSRGRRRRRRRRKPNVSTSRRAQEEAGSVGRSLTRQASPRASISPPRVRHILGQQSALSRRGTLRVSQGCPAIWQNNTHPRMSGIAVTPIDLKKWRLASHRQWTMATPPLPPVRAARRCCTIERRHRRYQCVAMADATRERLPVHAAFVQQLSP